MEEIDQKADSVSDHDAIFIADVPLMATAAIIC